MFEFYERIFTLSEKYIYNFSNDVKTKTVKKKIGGQRRGKTGKIIKTYDLEKIFHALI